MRALDALESLELLSSGQWGLVTTVQASAAGVSKMQLSRLADRGTLQRVRHGVYALPSADTGPLQGLRAAWLATSSQPAGNQPLAVVSGESAASLHGFGDLLPSKYEFTTSVRRQTTQPDIRYRKRDLPDGDVTQVDGLPVTTAARTINDLATGGTDFDHLAVVVRDAVSTTDVASVALVQALEPAAERFGSSDGDALLSAVLKAAGYRPDLRALELSPALRKDFLQALAPQLKSAVSEAVAEQLRQLAPKIDFASVAQQLTRAALPDTKVMNRALSQVPVRMPESRQVAAQKPGPRNAVRRQNRKADDGTPVDPVGSKPPESLPERQTGD